MEANEACRIAKSILEDKSVDFSAEDREAIETLIKHVETGEAVKPR